MSPSEAAPSGSDRGADLRLVAVAAVAWAATLAGLRLAPWWWLPLLLVLPVLARRGRRHHLAWALVALAFAASAWVRVETTGSGAVPRLARDRATVTATVRLASDPALREGRFSRYVVVRGTVLRVTGRGAEHVARAPVLIVGPASWAESRVGFGHTVRVQGRLAEADSLDLAAVLSARGPPEPVSTPSAILGGLESVRAALRASVAHLGAGPRTLVPALVVGDDSGMPVDVVEDFRTSGLTHLLAVSGTNLTLVVGALLVLARGVGVRGRALVLVGLVGVAFFVLLARPEPSVLRAAAMGTVALLGLGSAGPGRGVRALGAAVLALLALDPWLGQSWGFALSACATAGILFLAPGWRDALRRWLPRWLAEALAVPLAAQVACTPLVAALSGQVSLVAVGANLVAGPLVAPATVLGLAGGLIGVVSPDLARLPGTLAGWSAAGIIAVARRAAALPTAAIEWDTGGGALAALTVLSAGAALALRPVLARRGLALAASGVLAVVVVVPLPRPGWPPEGWVMVVCDVGQGDGLVLDAGPGAAVVVDAGPDPEGIDRCLDRLGVRRVPLVVLTHFHADHVSGLTGVLEGREVGGIEVTDLAAPGAMVADVRAAAAAYDVPVRLGRHDERAAIGPLRWRLVAPSGPPPPDSGSPPNDASLVMLVRSRGVSLLLAGDQEPPSQERLHRERPDLRADVLKVAHHGSAHQDPDLIASLGARLALISVGAANDYGHPHPDTLALLRSLGMVVRRTDVDGDLAVVSDQGRLRVVTSR